ncbi:LuxR C-terminal-related transcriptional regulator [Specibacter sp. NPDC057265]|uniref:LuxR C-terminal-related transcriptional regulator n=1 Tax=Specibacter sp. NPDC057265 TaxID=3346075 RepID=UPI00362C71C9
MSDFDSMLGKTAAKAPVRSSHLDAGGAPGFTGASRMPARLHNSPLRGMDQRGLPQGAPEAQPRRSAAPRRAFIGRAPEIAALSAALTLPRWRGAVVVGPGGIGKTALIQDVVGQLPGATPTRYLRGTTLTQGTPYGILGLLLGRSSSQTPSLVHVLQAVTAHLAAAPATGTPVVVVDNAEYADRWSALALSELARTGSIRLILACRRINDMAAEFSHLWRRGIVLRVDVPALSHADARALMSQELSGACSLAAATLAWQKSAGNPLHLKSLLRQAVDDGALLEADGSWVWREGRLRATVPPGLGQVTRMLNDASGNVALLELVAAATTIPVATLASVHPIADIDQLLRSGDLGYVGNGKSSLQLAHPVLASVLPLQISKERSRAMFAAVEAVAPLAQQHGSALQNRVSWGVACGALAPGSGVHDISAAADAAEHAATATAVTGLQGLLPERTSFTAEQSLELARGAQSLALAGRQDEALELACSLTARMALGGCAAPPAPAAPLAAALVVPLLQTFTLCGEWELQDLLLAACRERGVRGDLRDCAVLELTHGLVQGFRGKYDLAVALLEQAHAQLRNAGMRDWADLAQLAKFSATVLLGHSGLAGAYAPGGTKPAGGTAGTPWEAMPQAVQTLTLLRGSQDIPELLFTLTQCLFAEATPPAARTPILALGSDADAPARRLLLLGVQVESLDTERCEELLMLAAAQEGALAELLGLYAKALLAQDSSLLVQAVDNACTLDYPGLSTKAARIALSIAPPASARGIRRQLQRLVKLPEDLFDPASVVNSQLTERERSVGMMAANGLSNKDIALGMGISIRTVEGHLYQIYSKLHVSNRAELIPFLKDAKA